MFKDQTLLPVEAVRLAALGFLAEGPRRYGDLAMEIRSFIGLAIGPSLDLMGSSIELLRYEGLATVDGEVLTLTRQGRDTLKSLLQAPLRAPTTDASRLVLLLQLRFLHHLDGDEQAMQRAQIAQSLQTELARLDELRQRYGEHAPILKDWLDRDIAELAGRIATFHE